PGFKVHVHSNDIFVRVLTPDEPEAPARTQLEYPSGDISFLHGINAIGTKFMEANRLGPQSTTNQFSAAKMHGGKLTIKLTFDFN
nr:hypothetical protein [Sunxiuqinia sp.]